MDQVKLERLQGLMVSLKAVEKEKKSYMAEIKDQITALKAEIDALVTELEQGSSPALPLED